jgi:thiamine-monophosphate kinase
MRGIATNPAARGLLDDAAVLEIGSETLVITHDMMVEGVHWLSDADPADVAWKLVAVNLSDLAAKAAKPVGVMLGYTLGDNEWDRSFASGLAFALDAFSVPLLGGDSVAGPKDSKRFVGMTALGLASHRPVPSRSGARPGDLLYVTGTIGDAMAGFRLVSAGESAPSVLADAFNRPVPLLTAGRALAPYVSAMMDISDGLLLDANRMCDASRLELEIDISAIPLSADFVTIAGDGQDVRIEAASWGDDYQLLFAADEAVILPVHATAVGRFATGKGLKLHDAGTPVPLPVSTGFEHR